MDVNDALKQERISIALDKPPTHLEVVSAPAFNGILRGEKSAVVMNTASYPQKGDKLVIEEATPIGRDDVLPTYPAPVIRAFAVITWVQALDNQHVLACFIEDPNPTKEATA